MTHCSRMIVVALYLVATQLVVVVIDGFTIYTRTTSNIRPEFLEQIQTSQQQQQRQRHLTTLLRSSETETSTTTTTEKRTLDGRKINGPVAPLNNFLLIRVAKAIEATTGGILLSGKAKQVKTEGTVVAVGPGKTHPDSGMTIPMPVPVGMNVVYGKYDGTEIDYNGEKHTLIRDDDILITYTSTTLDSLDTVEVVRDNILVYVEEKEVATEGGILIAKTSKSESKPSIGLVVKIGPGKMAANGEIISITKPTTTTTTDQDDTTLLQVGDYIKFRDYAGNEVTIDGKEYTVVKMADVLAKF
jgi:chaperonin GroES